MQRGIEEGRFIPEQVARESKEQVYAEKTFLITAGATGTGLHIAKDLHGLGAHVVLGTRTPQNYEKAHEALGDEKVSPFVADLTIDEQVDRAVDGLGTIHGVVHCAAGGMEGFSRGLMVELMKRRKLPPVTPDDDPFKEQVRQWVEESRPYTTAVNFEGPAKLLEKVTPHMEPDSYFVFTSSTPSSLYGQINQVPYYEAVAQSKHAFEEHLKQEAPRLVDQGIFPAIVSGNAIADSNVGKLINMLSVRRLPPEERALVESSNITMEDMNQAVKRILETNPRSLPKDAHPQVMYVLGPGNITTESPLSTPFVNIHMPI